MALFTARGYQTTGFAGSRAAARGVVELPDVSPTYVLPYLGWGVITPASLQHARGYVQTFQGAWCAGGRLVEIIRPDLPSAPTLINGVALPYLGTGSATNSISRGPFYPPQNSWQTIARGKFWLGIGPIVKKFPMRFVLGAPPSLNQLLGRASWRKQHPEDYVPNPLGVVLPRVAIPTHPYPDYLCGSVNRREGYSEDILPLSFLLFSPRVVSPIPPFPDLLFGRAGWRKQRPEDYAPNPLPIVLPRLVSPVPPWPGMLNGRALRIQPHNVIELFSRETTLLQSMLARGRREAQFLQSFRARGIRVLAQVQDINAFTRAGYRVFAFNFGSAEETDLGFVPLEGPLSISGAPLVEGNYEIRFLATGHWWQDVRFATVFPITITGGEIEASLPIVQNLAYAIQGEVIYISWTWELEDSTQTPDDFAIWIASSEPVDTIGAPAFIVPAIAPGAVTVAISPSGVEVAAVCARQGIARGPVSIVYLESRSELVESPFNQNIRYPLA